MARPGARGRLALDRLALRRAPLWNGQLVGAHARLGFYAEAALLAGLGLSGRIVFVQRGRSAWSGIGLLVAAALIWPVLAPLDGRPWREAEVVAIAPDPTGIATLGLLALAERSRWTALLCIAPVLWLALSTLTLVTMGAWQGWVVLAALLAGLAAWAAPLVRKPG